MNRHVSAETRSERRRRERSQNAEGSIRENRNTPASRREVEAAPSALSLMEWAGLGALYLALVLSPAIGGYPAGATYGADVSLSVLRLLILLSGFILLVLAPPRGATSGMGRTAELALGASAGLTTLSLLIHSRFLTSDTLLFAMLPATLDWLSYFTVFAVALRYAANPHARRGMIIALAIGAGWVALTAVDSYLGTLNALAGAERDYRVAVVAWFIRLFEVTVSAPANRAQGAFFSPNFLAGFLALTLPVTVAAYVSAPSKRYAYLFGIAVGLSAAGLFVTGSRSGIVLALVGLAVAFALFLFARGFSGLPWTRIGTVIAILLVFALAFRGPIFNRVSGGAVTQEHSGEFRSWTWRGTQAMAQANPLLGTGPGTFSYVYPRYALVARTDLAHSSYLQIAAEQGFPVLLIVGLALIAAFGAAGRNLKQARDNREDSLTLLLCGVTGGILAAVVHNAFDSEWSLLGNALPFWAIAGIASGIMPSLVTDANVHTGQKQASEGGRGILTRGLVGIVLMVALSLSAVLWRGAVYREEIIAAMKTPPLPTIDTSRWPADPNLYYYARKLEDATRIEPTGKRFYQLGRLYADRDKMPEAIEAIKKSLEAEPTSLQSWRKLAEFQTQIGNIDGAMEAWRELVKRQEGPVGLYRAIPELPETHAAFAYAALASNDEKRNNNAEALKNWEKAANVIEEYSRTNETYQQVEIANAIVTGVNTAVRREELTKLYRQIIEQWSRLAPDKATELAARREETLSRLAAFGSTSAVPPLSP